MTWDGQERRDYKGIEAVIESAAERGVYKALSDLTGRSLEKPEDKAAIRDDFQYLHTMNESCKAMKKTSVSVMIKTLIVSGLVLLVAGLKEWFRR